MKYVMMENIRFDISNPLGFHVICSLYSNNVFNESIKSYNKQRNPLSDNGDEPIEVNLCDFSLSIYQICNYGNKYLNYRNKYIIIG